MGSPESLVGPPNYNPNKLLPKIIRNRHRHMLAQISGKGKDSADYVSFAFLYYSY